MCMKGSKPPEVLRCHARPSQFLGRNSPRLSRLTEFFRQHIPSHHGLQDADRGQLIPLFYRVLPYRLRTASILKYAMFRWTKHHITPLAATYSQGVFLWLLTISTSTGVIWKILIVTENSGQDRSDLAGKVLTAFFWNSGPRMLPGMSWWTPQAEEIMAACRDGGLEDGTLKVLRTCGVALLERDALP